MTIRTKLTLMAAAMSALTIVAVLVLFTTGNLIIATARDSEAHARSVAGERVRLALALGDQAASVRQFILSVDERDARRLEAAVDIEAEAAVALASDPLLPASVAPAVTDLREAARAWRDDYARPAMDAVRSGRAADARSVAAVTRDRDLYAVVQERLDTLNGLLVARPSTGLAALELVSTIRLVVFAASIVAGVLAFVISVRALRSLVSEPLAQLVRTAHAVEQGEPATFHLRRRDEIGDLAGSLERMRHVIDAGRREADALADEASIVNYFTELTAFTETDVAAPRRSSPPRRNSSPRTRGWSICRTGRRTARTRWRPLAAPTRRCSRCTSWMPVRASGGDPSTSRATRGDPWRSAAPSRG